MNNKTVGEIIRLFRKAFGETQQQLADAIYCERQAVSQYETGKRKPDDETIMRIAKHYQQPLSAFFDSDWTGLHKIQIDTDLFNKHIDVFFPTVVSEKALRDVHFSLAYKLHTNAFSSWKESLEGNEINDLYDSLGEYIEALDNKEISEEVSLNILSVYYFLINFCKSILTIPDTMPFYSLFYNNIKKLEEGYITLETYARNIFDAVYEPDEINQIKETAINSSEWINLAYYYLALEYLLRIVDNNNSDNLNRSIGLEMLSAFAIAGNKYADNVLRLFSKE